MASQDSRDLFTEVAASSVLCTAVHNQLYRLGRIKFLNEGCDEIRGSFPLLPFPDAQETEHSGRRSHGGRHEDAGIDAGGYDTNFGRKHPVRF
jgi:hypothetical protein